MPTTASTDAPCSANAVLYRPDGEFDKYAFFKKNPTLVIVDTSIVARAPARLLAAGMGDALATNVEAKRARNSPNFGGGMPALISTAICQKCEEILFKHGKQAYEACKVNAMTPALEAIVEANTLLSGLGFESGGLAAAHAIHDGLTSIHRLHHLLHGEKVAFGTVCQLVLDGAPQEEIDRYLGFLLSVDLPVTFDMMGIPDVTAEELHKVRSIVHSPVSRLTMPSRLLRLPALRARPSGTWIRSLPRMSSSRRSSAPTLSVASTSTALASSSSRLVSIAVSRYRDPCLTISFPSFLTSTTQSSKPALMFLAPVPSTSSATSRCRRKPPPWTRYETKCCTYIYDPIASRTEKVAR